MSKHKDRSKFKAASSARAAAQVGQPVLLGFAAPDDADAGAVQLTPRLRAVLRKLQKKDATTKIKALKELCELIATAEDEELGQVVDAWPKALPKLALDGSFKVREGAALVLGTLGPRSGRRLEKRLGSLLPLWLLAAQDPYPEMFGNATIRQVRAAAVRGLAATLPSPEKRAKATRVFLPDVVGACRELLADPLKHLKAGTEADDTVESTEGRSRRLRRTALGGLEALAAEGHPDMGPLLDTHIFAAWPKLWKLPADKDTGVSMFSFELSVAFFRCLRSWLAHLPTTLLPQASNFLPPILKALKESSSPGLASAAWDSWLLCVGNKDFHSVLEGHRPAALSAVASLLRTGIPDAEVGSVVGPCLGPTLAFLLDGEAKEQTAATWMDAMRKGLTSGSNKSFIVAYSDCLRTVVAQLPHQTDSLIADYVMTPDELREDGRAVELLCRLTTSGKAEAAAMGALEARVGELCEGPSAGEVGPSLCHLDAFAENPSVLALGLRLLDALLQQDAEAALRVLPSLPPTSLMVSVRRDAIRAVLEARLGDGASAVVPLYLRLSSGLTSGIERLSGFSDPLVHSALLCELGRLWEGGKEKDAIKAFVGSDNFAKLWGQPSKLEGAVLSSSESAETAQIIRFAVARCAGVSILSESQTAAELSTLAAVTEGTTHGTICSKLLATILRAIFESYPRLSGSIDGLKLIAHLILCSEKDLQPIIALGSTGNEAAVLSTTSSLLHHRLIVEHLELSSSCESAVLGRLLLLGEGCAELPPLLPSAAAWAALVDAEWTEDGRAVEWCAALAGAPALLLHAMPRAGSPSPPSERLSRLLAFELRLLSAFPAAEEEDAAADVLTAAFAALYVHRLTSHPPLHELALGVCSAHGLRLSPRLASLGAPALLEAERRRTPLRGEPRIDESPGTQLLRARLSPSTTPLPAAVGGDWSPSEWRWLCVWGSGKADGVAAWLTAASHDASLEELLLGCADLRSAEPLSLLFNAGLAQHLLGIAPQLGDLPSDQKDFLLCSLVAWLQSCSESRLRRDTSPAALLLATTVFRLFTATAKAVAGTEQELREEWSGFFLDGCAASLLPAFLSLAKAETDAGPWDVGFTAALEAAADATRFLNVQHMAALPKDAFRPLLEPAMDRAGYPADLQATLIGLRALPPRHPGSLPLLLAAEHLCSLLLPRVADAELGRGKAAAEEKDSRRPPDRALPEFLSSRLDEATAALESATLRRNSELSDGAPGLTLALLSGPVSSFLGAWSGALGFLSGLSREERAAFAAALAPRVGDLVLALLSLMPRRPRKLCSSFDGSLVEGLNAGEALSEAPFVWVPEEELQEYFLPSDSLLPDHLHHSSLPGVVVELERWSGRVFGRLLRLFPGQVRQWLNGQARGVAGRVSGFVEANLSPLLIRAELDGVRAAGASVGAMTLGVRREAGEVSAVYAVEELRMELVVRLPRSFPVLKPVVEEGARLRVQKEQWRKWMLQLSLLLEGSLLDGLVAWKRNVDEHLAGVEDCPICMMAVHLSTNQLPRLTCRQCKNKFHVACLYKWFDSSSNTTCPLCRNSFS